MIFLNWNVIKCNEISLDTTNTLKSKSNSRSQISERNFNHNFSLLNLAVSWRAMSIDRAKRNPLCSHQLTILCDAAPVRTMTVDRLVGIADVNTHTSEFLAVYQGQYEETDETFVRVWLCSRHKRKNILGVHHLEKFKCVGFISNFFWVSVTNTRKYLASNQY